MDPPMATAEPAQSPSLEEYQRLLLEVSDLRQQTLTFRNDIVRERRRREQMEEELRQEFLKGAPETTMMDDSERSMPLMDEEAPRFTSSTRQNSSRHLALTSNMKMASGNSNRKLTSSGNSNRQLTFAGGGGGLFYFCFKKFKSCYTVPMGGKGWDCSR